VGLVIGEDLIERIREWSDVREVIGKREDNGEQISHDEWADNDDEAVDLLLILAEELGIR
jgi:nicotinic acid mononucleotide adenylyltransferase